LETLPETKIRKTGRLGANVAADAIPHAADDHPEQPASDLRNAETPRSPVSLPETNIQKTSRLGADAAGAGVVSRTPDDNLEHPGKDLRNAETSGGPVPLPEANIQKTSRLKADAAAADIVLRSSEDPDQVASDRRLAEDYARATGRPAPPLELIRQFRDTFRQKMQEAQNAKILSEAPVLADWLRTPGNADLAGDDIENLGWFEWAPKATGVQVAATKPGNHESPAKPAKEGPPAPPTKTVQEALAEEIAGARGKGKDDAAALEDRIDKQLGVNQDIWHLVLKNVRDGNMTREQAISALIPGPPSAFALGASEVVKGFVGNAGVGVGKTVEGTGALARPWVPHVDPTARNSMLSAIAAINPKTWSADEIEIVRQKLYHQSALDPMEGRIYLDGIVSGDMTPENVLSLIEGEPPNFLEMAVDAIQSSGAWVSDNSEDFFAASPEMKDSWSRQAGEAVGSAFPAFVVGLLTRGKGTKYYSMLEAAGGAAREARKAGQDQATQSTAAYLALPAGFISGISPERLVPSGLAKRLPQTGATKFLTDLVIAGGVSGAQGAIQQAAKNAIAKYLYAPDQDLSASVLHNALSSGVGAMLLKGGQTGFKAALSGHLDGARVNTAETGAAQVSIAELSKAAQASKLRQRDPERFRQYVAQAVANNPIEYLNVPVRELFGDLQKQGINPYPFIAQLPGINANDLNFALAANRDLRIPTASYAAGIAGSKLDPIFTKSARFDFNGATAKEVAEFNARVQELMTEAEKNAEAASIDDMARRAVESAEKDAEATRVHHETQRFVKKTPGDGEAVDVDEQARRAVEGVDKDAETARAKSKAQRPVKKARSDPKAADADEQSRRAVEGVDKDAEIARVKRKALRPVNKLQRAAEN